VSENTANNQTYFTVSAIHLDKKACGLLFVLSKGSQRSQSGGATSAKALLTIVNPDTIIAIYLLIFMLIILSILLIVQLSS